MPFSSFAQGSGVEFVRNEGQWDGPFQYRAFTGRGDAYLSRNQFTYVLGDPSNDHRRDEVKHGLRKSETLRYHAYSMVFEAATTRAIHSSKEQKWYYNYFLGNDKSRWHSGIHPALALDYEQLYPGIDLHLSSVEGNLKYEFILGPGADPGLIHIRYDGADGLGLKGSNLLIRTSVGEVQELKPVAFQYTEQGRITVSCRYRVKGNKVSYELPDGYDRSLPLIIDPVVVFATFTGSTADNWGFTATYDAQGNFYAGGIVASTGFPVSLGAFQVNFGGGGIPNSIIPGDMAFIKYDPSGANKIWASYCGGSQNDQPHSMIVDAGQNLIIAGRSYSIDYPVSSGAYDVSQNGDADIVVTKFNSTGTALIGSTYIGGSGQDGVNIFQDETTFGSLKYNYGDDARSEVLIDKFSNVYITAATASTNFPVTASAFQSVNAGNQDGVVFKFSPTLSNLIWSTYLGGSGDDAGYVLGLDTGQTQLFVGGGTASNNFPSTGGTWKTTYQGGPADGFIARFDNTGSYALQKTTFIGTAHYDQVYGIQVDLQNSIYAMGQSLGGTFPVTAGVYSNPLSSQFVIKLDNNLQNNIYSTVFGSGDSSHTNISPVAFLVDTCQNVYISGWGGNLSIPTMNPGVGNTFGLPVTPTLISSPMTATTDGSDFYFIALSKNAQSLLFGSFYGRNSTNPFHGEHVDGGTSRFDKSGVIYQAICGGCGGSSGPPLPTTPGSFSTSNGSTNCNLAALKIAFQLGAVKAQALASPNSRGCPPFTVQFQNASNNATAYAWDFGDGSPVNTAATPQHTFLLVGNYQVRLIAQNPNACKVLDTTYLTIKVDTNHVKSDFNMQLLDSCGPFRASFTNTSQYSSTPGAPGITQFSWFFGDGGSFTGVNPPVHNYPGNGTYTILLVMRDTTACNNPDTMRKTLVINGNRVTAGFTAPDSICLNALISLVNTSVNATGTTWFFGDGQSSTSTSPTHLYGATGTYIITQAVVNPNTCNKVDTFRKTIKVKSPPIADFTFSPTIPVSNMPIQFINTSINATSYTWSFGDGTGSTLVNPSHLYRKSGKFNVCLIARNTDNCPDTVCKLVEADVRTLADLPSAFSPNGDGSNDILYVRGGGIETMNLKIFNRWGELVFESTDQNIGWDGTYKGKPQEMDAFAFVLNVTFIDGATFLKKGNVTLLR